MKRLLTILLAVALLFSLAACGEDNSGSNNNANGNGNGNGNGTSQGESSSTPTSTSQAENTSGDPVAAFAQFGVDVEKVKPTIGELSELNDKPLNNRVDNYNVLNRKATWDQRLPKGNTGSIGVEIGTNYNADMFEYIKSISEDGKCYFSESVTKDQNNPVEVVGYNDLVGEDDPIGFGSTWAYKYNGIWAVVMMSYNQPILHKAIGITIIGMGSY
jgi:hypothetical protein